MSTTTKIWKLPINLILKCFPSDVPGEDCKIEGDPNYPDYVNCKELSESQKVRNYLMYVSNSWGSSPGNDRHSSNSDCFSS